MTIGSIAAIAILAVTSGVSAPHGQSQAGVCNSPALRGATVKSVLTLQSAYQDHVSATEQTTVSVSEKWPGAALLLNQSGSPWVALNCLIPVDQQVYRNSPPTITEANSEVIVTDTTTATAYPSDGFAKQDSWSTSLWAMSEVQGRLDLSFGETAVSMPVVPVPVTWTIGLKAGNLPVSREQALPTADDGNGDLTWTVVAKPLQPPAESVDVTLPTHLAWEWKAWNFPFGILTDLANILSYGLAFYLVLLYLIRRFAKRAGASRQLGEATRTARRLAWAGVLLYVLACLNDVLVGQTYNMGVPAYVARLEALCNVLAGAFVYSSALNDSRRERLTAGILALFGILSIGTLFDPAGPGGLFPLNVLPLLVALFLLYTGCALWTCRLWLSISHQKQAGLGAVRLSKRQLRWCYVTAAVLSTADVLDPFITSSLDWAHQFLTAASTSRHDWVAANVAYNAQRYWLSSDLQNALWLVVALAFIAVLRMSVHERDIFFPGTGKLEMWSIAVMLGFVFEGYWGTLAGVPVPVALVLLVLGFRYVALTTRGTPAVARELRMSTGQASGGRLLADHKAAFYDAAERIADLESQSPGAGEGTASGPGNGGKSPLRDEIRQLKTRIPVNVPPPLTAPPRHRTIRWTTRRPQQVERPYLELPGEHDPARILLDSGPATNWWDNGIEAVRSGAVLIVIATAFNAYLQIRDGLLLPRQFAFGLTDTAFGIFYIAFGWAFVAFAFGACLPYLRGIRGPVKGFVVAVIHGAALGLGDLLLYITGEARSPDDLLFGLVFLFFLTTLGVLVDAKTVGKYGSSAGMFGRLYRLGDARAAVTYIAAIIIAVLGIWQQAATLSQQNVQRAQLGQQTVQSVASVTGDGSSRG